MIQEHRKAARRPVRYSASIALAPGKMRRCMLSDISATGARIDIEGLESIPDRFPLFLSRNGRARRVCTVVWRKPRQIGVAFATRLAAADRAKLEPIVDSPPLAPDDAAPAPAE